MTPSGRRALNPANVAKLCAAVAKKRQDYLTSRALDVAPGLERRGVAQDAKRLAAARAADALLYALDTADRVEVVSALADLALPQDVSLNALEKHYVTAAATARALDDDAAFALFGLLAEKGGPEAAAVLADVQAALAADPFASNLEQRIRELSARAQAILKPPVVSSRDHQPLMVFQRDGEGVDGLSKELEALRPALSQPGAKLPWLLRVVKEGK